MRIVDRCRLTAAVNETTGKQKGMKKIALLGRRGEDNFRNGKGKRKNYLVRVWNGYTFFTPCIALRPNKAVIVLKGYINSIYDAINSSYKPIQYLYGLYNYIIYNMGYTSYIDAKWNTVL